MSSVTEDDVMSRSASGDQATGSWRELFAALDDCPWPGPQPLDRMDATHVDVGAASADGRNPLLVGRDDDIVRFRRQVGQYRLILLTGSTGVGKTSLLQAGLVPDLVRTGEYTVGLCRDWSGSRSGSNAVEFLSSKVRGALAEQHPDLGAGAQAFWDLDREVGGRCVIILDQFEELIRDSPRLTDQIYDLLVELNRRTELRIVISFRSESLLEVMALERRVKPFTMTSISLETLPDSEAKAVITAANTEAVQAIDDVPASELAALWAKAAGAATASTRTINVRRLRIGLLHLQAMLYVLSAEAGRDDDGTFRTITSDHLSALLDDLREGNPDSTPDELFSRALLRSVEVKIDRCRRSSGGVDSLLVAGAVRALARAGAHLSSGGYKLIRDTRDLCAMALEDEMNALGRGVAVARGDDADDADGVAPRDHMDALLSAMLSLITDRDESGRQVSDAQERPDISRISRAEVALLVDEAPFSGASRPWAARLHLGASSRLADPQNVTSGLMSGMSPAAALIEEFRRFVLALDWMQVAAIARISTPGDGSAKVALIHDGFGVALERWASRVSGDVDGELASFTAPSGAEFIWKGNDGKPLAELDGGDGVRLIANARWRGAWIKADFSNVSFVNCDLRGAAFSECVFDGVTFVNCLLDGAMFSDCLVIGAPNAAPDTWRRTAPEYRVDAGTEVPVQLARYQDDRLGDDTQPVADSVLAPLPGLPARPQFGPYDRALLIAPDRAGLVIHGGRISAVTLRRISFAENARMALRQVAGSGLDVVEQLGGDFEIHASALRHLSVSPSASEFDPDTDVPSEHHRPQGEPAASTEQPRRLHLEIRHSSLMQAYIGAGLRGDAVIDNCAVVQFWNGSAHFRAAAVGSPYLDSHRLTVESDPDEADYCPRIDPERADRQFAMRFHRMDYRSDPSVADTRVDRDEEQATQD